MDFKYFQGGGGKKHFGFRGYLILDFPTLKNIIYAE